MEDENGYLRGKPEHSNLISRQIAYAEVYLKNREKYPLPFSEYVIHHRDRDKHNNSIKNLDIVTKEEHNEIHRLRLAGKKELDRYKAEKDNDKLLDKTDKEKKRTDYNWEGRLKQLKSNSSWKPEKIEKGARSQQKDIERTRELKRKLIKNKHTIGVISCILVTFFLISVAFSQGDRNWIFSSMKVKNVIIITLVLLWGLFISTSFMERGKVKKIFKIFLIASSVYFFFDFLFLVGYSQYNTYFLISMALWWIISKIRKYTR